MHVDDTLNDAAGELVATIPVDLHICESPGLPFIYIFLRIDRNFAVLPERCHGVTRRSGDPHLTAGMGFSGEVGR